jgi:hypothetical protein
MEDLGDFKPNAHVSPIYYLSNGVGYRLLLDLNSVPLRPEIIVIIEEHTEQQHILDVWPEIQGIKSRIISQLGSNLTYKYDSVLLDLLTLHRQGVGYGTLAKILNYRSLALICCAYYSGESPTGQWEFGITNLYFYFIGLRLGEEQLKQELDTTYDLLGKGIVPWKLGEGPFDWRRVRDNIDYFSDRVNEGKLTIKSRPDSVGTDMMVDCYLLRYGWYDKANGFLQQDRAYWKNHKKWIAEQLQQIKVEIGRSTSPLLEDCRSWLKSEGIT